MAEPNINHEGRIGEELLALIETPDVLDNERMWVNFNYLWAETEPRKKITDLLTDYLSPIVNWSSDKVLLYLDGITSFYGVLPIMGSVASNLGCKLAVWRELGQVILSEPWLLPSKVTKGLSCVVFQDIVARGTTLLKSLEDLDRVDWSVTHFVCLIRTSKGRESLESSLSTFRKSKSCASEFEFHSLIDAANHISWN